MTADPYIPPTAAEFRALLAALDLTGAKAAELMGLSGSRVVRRYTGGDDPRPVSFSLLYVLVHRAVGIEINQATWRDDIRALLDK
jgi:hypothetical protein